MHTRGGIARRGWPSAATPACRIIACQSSAGRGMGMASAGPPIAARPARSRRPTSPRYWHSRRSPRCVLAVLSSGRMPLFFSSTTPLLGRAPPLRRGREVDRRADLAGSSNEVDGEHRAQDALVHVGEASRYRRGPCRPRRQRRAEEDLACRTPRPDSRSRPCQRRVEAWYGAPVRHHPAGIMPVLLQHLVEQEVAVAGERRR